MKRKFILQTAVRQSLYYWLIAILLTVTAFSTQAANVEKAARVTNNFDADWRFFQGDAKGAQEAEFDDKTWRRLDVPHDWSIEGDFSESNPTGKGGGYLPAGIGWYRKHFTLSAADKMKRAFIEFDGVMANSEVWINGQSLGKRPYGYVSFAYELTPHLNFGKDNIIAVRADNSGQPASRWYTGAGIYRHVRLIEKNPLHLEHWGTFVSTPAVSKENATVSVAGEVVNQSDKTQNVSLQIEILDANGRSVASGETKPQSVAANATANLTQEINIKNPALWNLEQPNLYRAVARVRMNGKTITDAETVTFGIREAKFEAATGFWLNGRNFKIKGVCLHHDGSAFGAAVPLRVWERRLEILRSIGVNAIRTAHNPPSPEFLALCDRMGFLVMDEMFDAWTVAKNPYDYHLYFKEWAARDVRDTVRRDRNHPSVIIYSAGNEIHDTPKPEIAKPILADLVKTFHAADATRPVTQGLFRPNVSHDYDNGLADLLDVVGQNYRENEILAAHEQKPSRKILGTENTHTREAWLALRDNAPYAGQFLWSGIDYIGESGGWPTVVYNSGLLYRTGEMRPIAYQRQSWWSAQPMVYMARRVALTPKLPTDPGYNPTEERRPQVLFSDWTPRKTEAHNENVEVYSNCEQVELFLNGKSLGAKSKPADDAPRNWLVPFEAGTLKAVASNGGKQVAVYELRTAGAPAKIILTADKLNVAPVFDDVVNIEARVVDENGTVIPTANNEITFTTQANAAGAVVATDSADNNSHERFQGNTRRAYQSVAWALVKANRGSGKIIVTARVVGLPDAVISINAIASK